MRPHERPAGYDRARHGIHLLRTPEIIADPSVYIDAIADLGPLFFDEVGAMWVCSGYAEAVEILRNHRTFSSVREHDQGTFQELGLHTSANLSTMVHEQMLFMDPPQHKAIRTALAEQVSGTRVRSRENDLRQIAARALDDLPSKGVFDLVGDFAAKLPCALVAQLLGMEGREAELTRWAEAYERLLGSLSALPATPDPEVDAVLGDALAVLQNEARSRLRAPGGDVISSLTAPLLGREPTDGELFAVAANCIVLVGGGYQTLTHLVTSALLTLHDDPVLQKQLRETPELIPPAVAEFMRINGSSQYVARKATTDVTVQGTLIAAGESVLVHLAAANLDPRTFTAPRTLDLTRDGPKHLGFGSGRHACPGAGYAERLAGFTIQGFLAKYPAYAPEPEPEALSWGLHGNTRCLEHARIRVDAAATPEASADLQPAETDTSTGYRDPALPPSITTSAACWHEVFERQALLTPDALAVEGPDGVISYRELDHWANALAHRLRHQGAQPGTVVGIVMERSVEFVLAVLAVAKAGAAFLLADVSCPRERLRTMLDEAKTHLVVTDGSLPASVFGTQTIDVGAKASHPDAPLTGASPGDVAYLVFTSGSTGAPKAIAISHEATVNLHLAQHQIFRLEPGDRVLQFLSPNFDGCIADLTAALLSGATLIVAPADQLTVGPPLVRLLASQRITTAILTPSVWMALPSDQPLPELRIAAAAGERLPATWARRWAAPGRRLLNLYGPAETAVLATWHECSPGEDRPPIGRPVANKLAYVLDHRLRRVPPGQQGELWLGGVGVGRYLNQPDLMEERFIRNPHTTTDKASLLYRTGDICCQRPDGTLDYIGRDDRQVKIHGQRVELDELERVLESAPGVAACAAYQQDGRIGTLVVPAGPQLDETPIRTYLASRLHSAMLPAVFTAVTELPRTTNGKADHRRTPTNAPAAQPSHHSGPVPPPDAHARHLSRLTWEIAEHFAQVLDIPLRQVQADSDFFAAGGDSITIAAFLARLESLTGTPVDTAALITAPTPEQIAPLLLADGTPS
ncbi:amino acid adenylation domain-containing protein [Amycolatopsis cihanbeyliensis]|uniref:Amino acid adenylation domain-containing protein n=1 Tax=Amycolatopsis cihanbeyliensis TaxID=1128664 RepID=A0A542DF25_AMYCI|nr:amino acid adenylation domain-containing protein [Amycolatopsis cihanbeyliensis]TQJ01672.1 amino acid adenylation domain-containing protein [Amycolatopsis cihanbeyliensis]